MRIAFISYEYPPDTGKGGIGTYVAQMATCMARLGHDVHVFAGNHDRTTNEKTGLFLVHRVLCTDIIDFRSRVISVFTDEYNVQPFDLLESAEIHGNAWEVKKKFPCIPMVVRIHAPNSLVESLKKRYIPLKSKLRYLIGALRRLKWDLGYWRPYNREADPDYHFTKLADHITAPSEAMKEWTIRHWNIPAENIVVIPNLFSPSQKLLEIPIGESLSPKRVLFFGRLNVLKGMVNATKAMEMVLRKYPDWQFRIIGDNAAGPYPGVTMREWMKRQMHEVLDRVEFIDGLPYDQLPSKIADCEIVLLPSLFESFSYTCAEAMAAGKAIVGSKSGGMVDLLQGGHCGLLTDPESSAEIKEAVSYLIENPSARHDLGVKARQRVLEVYDAGPVGNEFDTFYRSVGGWKK
ncbi:MAG TPA: glycosyltransferase family 4 protein [Puia sp.]